MKSIIFASALVAAVNASWGGYGYSAPSYHTHTPSVKASAASASKGVEYGKAMDTHWDAWGRDQDLSIDESYGKTDAKSYSAESYDEWDNKDNDRWGAQSWGKDRDGYGASSQGYAASESDYDAYGKQGSYGAGYGKGYGGYGGYGNAGYGQAGSYGKAGYNKDHQASQAYGAQKGAYDNDVWAKQANGSDYDSRWGKSYDSVSAKNYSNENYAKQVRADDDQWAEDYDSWNQKDGGAYGAAASASKRVGGYGGYGYDAASKQGYGAKSGRSDTHWDAWGRDQDYKEDVSFDQTWAKSYDAESYDEWDNQDNDKWGAQAWGKDRDVYGASSYGKAASDDQYSSGKPNYWGGASAKYGAAQGGYDNDQWAQQTKGSDFDSRWGKSYDSVAAKSYDNTAYARDVWADDDQWAHRDGAW